MRSELVGRDDEFALLAGWLDESRAGRPRVVLCGGEPGIGKPRLAGEFAERAGATGATAVSGRAVDSGGAPPYWPWWQVLRALSAVTDLAGIGAEHRLAADLAPLAPDVFAAPGAAAANPSTEDRFRQFDAMARLLRQVTLQRPLVVVLDDVHASDEATLLLLQHLTRALTDERLLILATYRDNDRRPALVLSELRREPVTRLLDLRGLAAPAVARQLAAVVGHDVPDDAVARVHAATGGNPFFVGEVARSLADGAAGGSPPPVPAGVRDAIATRLAALSPGCAGLLAAASVAGEEFTLPVVAAMAGRPPAECLHTIDEAVAAGIVEPAASPETFRFSHALVRDAVEAGVAAADRVRLHRAAAEAVEALYGARLGPRVFDLARHWAVAAVGGDRDRATEWHARAGAEALRGHAYEEAARLFDAALDLGGGAVDGAGRCRLLLGLGAARYLSSDLDGGLAACVEAAAIARDAGRPDLAGEAALVVAPTVVPHADLTIRRLCEQALAVLGPEHGTLRARVTARFADACHYLGDVEPARAASVEVLAAAERSGDPVALAAALNARQLVCSGPDGLDERDVLAERMLDVGSRSADPDAQMWGHLWRVDAAFERGDLAGVARELSAAGRWAHVVGGPVARWQVLRGQAVLAQAQARFADARRIAAEAFATMAPTGHPMGPMMWGAMLSAIAHHTGHDAESLAANGVGDAAFGDDIPPAGVMRALAPAWILADVGRTPEAATVYRALGPAAEWMPTAHAALPAYALGIDVAVALGARDDVAVLRDRLGGYRGRHVVSGAGSVVYLGPVELWLGIAERHLGLFDDAVDDLEHAVKVATAGGAAGFEVEAGIELAGVLADRARAGDRTRARALVAEAARQAALLGMPPFAARAAALADRLDRAESAALTAREREVADLVAQGLTNREIATRLYLSERTAENHVQHILTKLDLPNRGQIAVWAAARR